MCSHTYLCPSSRTYYCAHMHTHAYTHTPSHTSHILATRSSWTLLLKIVRLTHFTTKNSGPLLLNKRLLYLFHSSRCTWFLPIPFVCADCTCVCVRVCSNICLCNRCNVQTDLVVKQKNVNQYDKILNEPETESHVVFT